MKLNTVGIWSVAKSKDAGSHGHRGSVTAHLHLTLEEIRLVQHEHHFLAPLADVPQK